MITSRTVFQKEEVRRLGDDDAAMGKGKTCRNIQVIGKDRELVGLAIAVGVFADNNLIVTLLLVFHDAVRVIGGLGNPKATAVIPGECDRLHNVWLGSEKLQLHVGRDLRALHAPLHRERLLVRQRLGTFLVIRYVWIFLPDFRFALGEKISPSAQSLRRKP